MSIPSRLNSLTILAASVLSAVLGSVHGFSVFLVFLENAFDVNRASASLTYSLALVFLTLAVLYGHRFYGRASPPKFALGVCLLAAAGAVMAAFAPNLWMVWFGYSLIFGTANGLGYGYALQLAGQALPERKGFAMGVVTAAYGIGAAGAPIGFAFAMNVGEFFAAMMSLACVLVITGLVTAILLGKSGARFKTSIQEDTNKTGATPLQTVWLWVGFGTGVAAGLMAIGHAAPIAQSLGMSKSVAVAAPALISLCIIPGAFLAGWLVDHLKPKSILFSLPLLSAAALLLLTQSSGVITLFSCLMIVGFAYGALIAVYPAIISHAFGAIAGIRIYGRVFTAWGSAGLAAPWFAGFLFDLNGNYSLALLIAGAFAVLSSLMAATLKLGH